MVFVSFGFLLPRAPTLVISLVALTFSWGVELSQLHRAPWIDSISAAVLGRRALVPTSTGQVCEPMRWVSVLGRGHRVACERAPAFDQSDRLPVDRLGCSATLLEPLPRYGTLLGIASRVPVDMLGPCQRFPRLVSMGIRSLPGLTGEIRISTFRESLWRQHKVYLPPPFTEACSPQTIYCDAADAWSDPLLVPGCIHDPWTAAKMADFARGRLSNGVYEKPNAGLIDSECRYFPDLHRVLADPSLADRLSDVEIGERNVVLVGPRHVF